MVSHFKNSHFHSSLTMKLSVPVLATLIIVPATSAWSCGPGGYGVVLRPGMMMDTITPAQIRRRQQDFINRAFTRTSPRYEIIDTEEEVKISLDVPGVKAEDISVSLEEDGKVLSVTGRREKLGESGSYTSKFSQSFVLDATVDIDKFSANLKNGVLVVTAPKDLKRIEKNIRKIAVTDADNNVSDNPNVEVTAMDQNKEPDADASENGTTDTTTA
jgi:HSP20 family molecular chaperone IbpA